MNVDFKQTLARADLVALFAPTLGAEKSEESVNAAVKALALPRGEYTVDQAISIVTEMGRTSGLVGIVARLAVARLRAGQAFREASSRPR